MTDFIIVFGMHRSGTSCLTGCLKNYGLQLGSVNGPSKYNQKGNQEKREVFRLNDAILNFNQGSWHNPPNSNILKIREAFKLQRDEIIHGFEGLPKPWGIKDPRMLLTYGFWQNKLQNHQFIGTFRHPANVAYSLAARGNLAVPIKKGFELWFIYNKNLLNYHEKYEFPIINFDLPQEQYIEKVREAAKLLSLNHEVESDFFDPNLKHQKADNKTAMPEKCLSLYKQLLSLAL